MTAPVSTVTVGAADRATSASFYEALGLRRFGASNDDVIGAEGRLQRSK